MSVRTSAKTSATTSSSSLRKSWNIGTLGRHLEQATSEKRFIQCRGSIDMFWFSKLDVRKSRKKKLPLEPARPKCRCSFSNIPLGMTGKLVANDSNSVNCSTRLKVCLKFFGSSAVINLNTHKDEKGCGLALIATFAI